MQQHPGHFTQTLDWALKHLSDIRDVDTLAARANMSRRSFDRKFRNSFNLSPLEWLIAQKVASARGLLEQQRANIDSVATQAGFDNAATLRHHFRKLVGISPSQYRAQFFQGRKGAR